jgi:hypothetical protein
MVGTQIAGSTILTEVRGYVEVVIGIYHVNIVVRDLDRSRSFYEMPGFQGGREL